MAPSPRTRRGVLLILLLAFGLLAAACGSDDSTSTSDTTAGEGADTTEASTEPVTVRLGYFPNITHAPGIVGDLGGLFAENVGDNVTIETSSYNAGPEAVERWKKARPNREWEEFVEEIPYGETQDYVRKVLRSYYLYSLLYGLDRQTPLYGEGPQSGGK